MQSLKKTKQQTIKVGEYSTFIFYMVMFLVPFVIFVGLAVKESAGVL